MSLSTYNLDDIQQLDELCYQEALTMGIDPPNVLFHLVQSEEMYDIAARGLPGRYSHYRFGRAYEQQKGDYDRGRGRIYELVINTNPVHAYLLDGNSLIAQLLTIAHVYGHAVVFEHSEYFAPADKNILSRVRSATERIDTYIAEYGRAAVEDFIDHCEALQYQGTFAQLGKKYTTRAPEWKDDPYDILFPEEREERLAKFLEDKEEFKHKFPLQPERNILKFVEHHSQYLEDWQRDIVSIIRAERDYFIPQMKTQVLNEGIAVTWHNTILQRIMTDPRFSADDFTEFVGMNARVLHPKIMQHGEESETPGEIEATGINPYLLGSVIFEEIERICVSPTDEEKERWPDWAGEADPLEKRAEIIRVYDDAALINEFLSPKVCERSKLFWGTRSVEKYKNLVVSEEECDKVREFLVKQKRDMGIPVIEITDADYKNQGVLYMEHRHEGVGLDQEYMIGTLRHLYHLWRRPVVVKTINRAGDDEWCQIIRKAGEPTYSILSKQP